MRGWREVIAFGETWKVENFFESGKEREFHVERIS